MSREITKNDLLYYLNDTKVRVIALKGLWGTGKTHLWEEIRDTFPLIKKNDHLYASCFGLESLDQLKMTLFQNSLGRAENTATLAQKLSGFAIETLEKVSSEYAPKLTGVATIVGSLGNVIQSTLVDKALHSRLIVLDDIERRANSLLIETLLGFIDLLKHNHCKILIILNEEPLEESGSVDWRTLKEKCIDREISLLTTSAEAANIGLSKDTLYRALIIDTLDKLQVSNIRVIQRIERVVKSIFESRTDLPNRVIEPMLSATVTLTSLNFNAVPNGPSIISLEKEWLEWCTRSYYSYDNQHEMSDAVAFCVNINLTRDVEFLALLIQHILTGHRLKEQFNALILQRQIQENSNQAENAATQYIEATYLDPKMTDQDFIALATSFKSKWSDIPADKVSAITNDLQGRGATSLAQEIAEKWAQQWRKSEKLWDSRIHSIDNFYPEIKKAILDVNSQLSTPPSLIDAIFRVSSAGWSPCDTTAINCATIDEVIQTIYSLDKESFSSFIYFYREEINSPTLQAGEGQLFRAGVDIFLQAARQILAENTHLRITELLKLHLGEQRLSV